MTRNHATEKKLTQLLALPEMCRIMKKYLQISLMFFSIFILFCCSLFLADKKAAMTVEEVTDKLIDGTRTSRETVEAHLNLIEDVLPQWFKRVTVRKVCYIKIDRNMSIKSILEKIERYRDSL